jgi:hypothetical protein
MFSGIQAVWRGTAAVFGQNERYKIVFAFNRGLELGRG